MTLANEDQESRRQRARQSVIAQRFAIPRKEHCQVLSNLASWRERGTSWWANQSLKSTWLCLQPADVRTSIMHNECCVVVVCVIGKQWSRRSVCNTHDIRADSPCVAMSLQQARAFLLGRAFVLDRSAEPPSSFPGPRQVSALLPCTAPLLPMSCGSTWYDWVLLGMTEMPPSAQRLVSLLCYVPRLVLRLKSMYSYSYRHVM